VTVWHEALSFGRCSCETYLTPAKVDIRYLFSPVLVKRFRRSPFLDEATVSGSCYGL
jgi:alpha-D-ribose 1-methylphosphonate 5-phosphate C-P lyase